MIIRPTFLMRPIAATPSLPAILARIRRTPTARLINVYRLVGCRRPPRAWKPPCPRDVQRPLVAPGLRTLGQSIDVVRLVTGDDIGTPLNLGCAAEPLGGVCNEVGVHVDVIV